MIERRHWHGILNPETGERIGRIECTYYESHYIGDIDDTTQ